jgi:hypothetical protein
MTMSAFPMFLHPLPGNPLQKFFAGLRKPSAPSRPVAASVHALHKSGIIALPRPAQRRIVCTKGCVWLTHDGWPEDVVLEVGESHMCTRSSRLLVSAIQASSFVVE